MLCFHREKENLIFCLQEATTCDTFLANVTDELTNMDIFLDTIFWNDTTLLNKVYDQFLSKCKDKTTSHSMCYTNVLLSKSFGVLHWPQHCADSLLSEAHDAIKQISSVPPDVQGKLFCFCAFRKLILNQVDEGIIFFEKGIPLLRSQLSQVVIKVLALRVLADCYALKENTDKASATMQEALSLSKKHQQLKRIIIIQQTQKHEVDYANQPFFGAIAYFLSHFSSITKATNHVKDFLLQAIKTTEQLRESKGDTLEIAKQYDMHASSLESVGCDEEATKVRRHALDIKLKLLGEDNEDTAWSYYNLGMTHYDLGDYSSALDAYQHSLDIRLKILGENNENTAWSYYRLGMTHYKLSDYSSSLYAETYALDIRLKLLGEVNENTAWSYYNLGMTHFKLGNYSSALDTQTHALDITLTLLGEDNEDTARSYYNLGMTHYKLGDYSSALDAYQHSLDIRLKILGENNENTAWSYYRLGMTHYKLSDYSSSLYAETYALDIRLKLLGEVNENTAWSYYNLGMTHYQLGDYSSALDTETHALDIMLTLLGEDNEDTAWSYYNLGMIHYKLSDYSSALDAYQHSLDIRLKILGENNENTAWSYYRLGMTHYQLGDYRSALDARKHSLDIRLKLLGEDNENTARSRRFVHFLTSKLGQSEAVEAQESN